MTREEACAIIARYWTAKVYAKREAENNMSDKGVLFTRKRKYNK